MSDFNLQIGKVQVVWRHSSKLLKTAVIALIVLSTAAMAALLWVRSDIMRQTEDLRSEAAAIEHENEVLNEKIDNIGSIQSMLDYAQEELDMVDPDTVLIQPQS